MSERPKRKKLLIYGEPGSGKTPLIASSAKLGPTLILNADGPDGPESARAAGYDPDIWDIDNYKDLDDAVDYLSHHQREWEWVWFDGITLHQDQNIQYILGEVPKVQAGIRDPDVPDKPEYLKEQTKTSKAVRRLKGLNFNFGMTAHILRIDDEDEGTVYLPSIQGGKGTLSAKISGHFALVGWLHVVRVRGEEGKKRVQRLTTQFDGKHLARDRYNATQPHVDSPTMEKLVELIDGAPRKPQIKKATRRSRA